MQHELFANPVASQRRAYPFLTVLQADIANGARRVVAPLAPGDGRFATVSNRLLPSVTHDGRAYVVFLQSLGTIEASRLKHPVGSIAPWRDDIARGLDWLLWGI